MLHTMYDLCQNCGLKTLCRTIFPEATRRETFDERLGAHGAGGRAISRSIWIAPACALGSYYEVLAIHGQPEKGPSITGFVAVP
jgi:hypothetical protein